MADPNDHPVTVQIDRDTLFQLLALLRECSEDLEAHVNAEYTLDMRDHPAMERRYIRDMGPISRARVFLAKWEGR